MRFSVDAIRMFIAGGGILFVQLSPAALASSNHLLFRPDRKPLELEWGEIMHGRTVEAALRPENPVEFEVLPERTRSLAAELQADPELARIAVKRALEKPAPFDQGVYGKIGRSTVYVAPARRVKSTNRLYWTMVRVLSEKYGCFIVDKNRDGEDFKFHCRDGRHVRMKRKVHGTELSFWGRQYHANGDEVEVRPSRTGRTAFLDMLKRRRGNQ